jgi:hypothetical protein
VRLFDLSEGGLDVLMPCMACAKLYRIGPGEVRFSNKAMSACYHCHDKRRTRHSCTGFVNMAIYNINTSNIPSSTHL